MQKGYFSHGCFIKAEPKEKKIKKAAAPRKKKVIATIVTDVVSDAAGNIFPGVGDSIPPAPVKKKKGTHS